MKKRMDETTTRDHPTYYIKDIYRPISGTYFFFPTLERWCFPHETSASTGVCANENMLSKCFLSWRDLAMRVNSTYLYTTFHYT